MPIRQSVDIEKLDGFRSFLEDNPDKVRLHLEARAVYEGQAGRCMVHIGPYGLDEDRIERETRHYTVPFGAWREVEETLGVEGPTDRTSGLEISINSTVDPRVLFAVKGPEEHGSCLKGISYEVKVTGDVSDDDLATIQELCKHSPVHGMMTEPINVSGMVTRA